MFAKCQILLLSRLFSLGSWYTYHSTFSLLPKHWDFSSSCYSFFWNAISFLIENSFFFFFMSSSNLPSWWHLLPPGFSKFLVFPLCFYRSWAFNPLSLYYLPLLSPKVSSTMPGILLSHQKLFVKWMYKMLSRHLCSFFPLLSPSCPPIDLQSTCLPTTPPG